jgi:hypothetical protein
MKCAYHGDREVSAACSNCGKLICADCSLTAGGKFYCQPCVEIILAQRQREKVHDVWWLAPIFMLWVGGVVAWFVNKDIDRNKAKNMLITGLILTFALLASPFACLAMIDVI